MTRRRPTSNRPDQFPRDAEIPRGGFQIDWLAHDRRSFAEILQAWQERTAPNDPIAFLRDQLRLAGTLSAGDLMHLLTGEAVPSRELAIWLAAIVPAGVASARVLRNRGLSAFLKADPACRVAINPDALVQARCARLGEILSGQRRPGPLENRSAFFDELMERLCECMGRDDLEPAATASNLAKHLHISADALQGYVSLPEHEAEAAANQLASMLGLTGQKFDDFADRAASTLSRPANLRVDSALTRLADASRFLRAQAGITQVELAERLGESRPESVAAIEQGYPALGATQLQSALARIIHDG